MQTEAQPVMVVVEGGKNTLNAVHGTLATESASTMFANKQIPFHHHQSQIGAVSQLLAGGIAGAVGKTCTAPFARLTILFQVQGMHSDVTKLNKANMLFEASRIVREEGYKAFWKGNLVTIVHRLPYSALSFYAYERYKNLLRLVTGQPSHRDYGSSDIFIRLVGGGLAGITAAAITYPLDLVRTRIAVQTNVKHYRGIWNSLYTIRREEGLFGLYKGLGTTLLGVGPNIAISYSFYETLKSSWQSHRPHDSAFVVSLACGSCSGIASSTVTFPLDLVRRRMQLEGACGRDRVYKMGVVGTFRQIIQAEGLRGLYRGILPEYYKVVPGVAIVFLTYEKMKTLLPQLVGS